MEKTEREVKCFESVDSNKQTFPMSASSTSDLSKYTASSPVALASISHSIQLPPLYMRPELDVGLGQKRPATQVKPRPMTQAQIEEFIRMQLDSDP